MANSRRCEDFNFDDHRASMQKHLRSRKTIRKQKQNELVLPERFFEEEQTPIKKNFFKKL